MHQTVNLGNFANNLMSVCVLKLSGREVGQVIFFVAGHK